MKRNWFIFGAAACLLAVTLSCDEGDNAVGLPDDAQPVTVDGVSLVIDAGNAVLSWSSPPRGDALMENYEIRYTHALPFAWETAARVDAPPLLLPAGETQTYRFQAPRRGSDLYVQIRVVDVTAAYVAESEVAHVYVPGFSFEVECLDAFSGLPVENLDVTVTARAVHHLRTGADGRAGITDVGDGVVNVVIQSAGGAYHDIENATVLDADVARTYTMIPYQVTDHPNYDSLLQMLNVASVPQVPSKVLRKWRELPVTIYIPEFVNMHGLDYHALTVAAAQHWNDKTGVPLFAVEPNKDLAKIEMRFLPRSEMGIQNGVTQHFDDEERYPSGEIVRVIDEFSTVGSLNEVLLHELGHTIRFWHLASGLLMFGGQPLPPDITDDEVRLAQLHAALPNPIDLSVYRLRLPAALTTP